MKLENGWRYTTLFVSALAVAVVIAFQLVRIQFTPQAQVFLDEGDRYSGEWRVISPPRGQIFDRWGNLLAGNETVYEVGVELQQVNDPEAIAFVLNGVLGVDYAQIYAAASQPASETAVYVTLADFVPPDQVEVLRSFVEQDEVSLAGLEFRPHLQRSYPEKELGGNILGFVNREGQGFFGVEAYYQDILAGQQRSVWIPSDPNRVEELPQIPPGASLVLTIDREIQMMVEDVLDTSLEVNGARSGTIVVMNPKTGEILAMASTPRFDINEFWRYTEIYPGATPFNRAVSQTYEPGSVFKIFTMASALDSETVEPDTPFLDPGSIQVGGVVINNWDGAAWGPQNMLGCMQHSLNVCLAWVGTQLGSEKFYDYMNRFGFGHTTGVDLFGEAPGRLKIPGDGDWYPADLGTNTFGQGVSVTPVQMLMGASAIATDGRMVLPHVVKALVDNGSQYTIHPQYVGQPISAETADTLTAMLAESLENEASTALVNGYRLAGKTGTAEIPSPEGYTSGITNASFIGWGPVDDPQFMVYVWFEAPTTSIWGSVVAAPVFAQVVERLVILLDLPPDMVRSELGNQ